MCASQSLVVPDLIHGEEYLFRIRAENRFGFGPFVETTEGTKARDPIRTLEPSSVSVTGFFTGYMEKTVLQQSTRRVA